jgi:hypothetical protein
MIELSYTAPGEMKGTIVSGITLLLLALGAVSLRPGTSAPRQYIHATIKKRFQGLAMVKRYDIESLAIASILTAGRNVSSQASRLNSNFRSADGAPSLFKTIAL